MTRGTRRAWFLSLCLAAIAGAALFLLYAHQKSAITTANTAPKIVPPAGTVSGFGQGAESAQSGPDLAVALIRLKNAVRLAPRDGQARAQLGLALAKSGDSHGAERELRQALADGASQSIVIPAILDTMLVQGETRELLEEFPDPRPGASTDVLPDILRARAQAFQILGRPKDASAAMDRALEMRRDVRGLTAMAKLAIEQDDLSTARRFIEQAVALGPHDEDAVISQIGFLYRSEDFSRALAVADEFLTRTPSSTIARVAKIEILLAMNREGLARTELGALVAQSPDSSFGPYYRGVFLVRAGKFREAWHEQETLQPEFILSKPAISMMVAETAIGSGNLETGRALLAALVSRRPDLAMARIRLAELALRQKNPDAALTTLAPLKNNEDPEVQAILGQANLQLGRFEDAIRALERAIGSTNDRRSTLLKQELAQSAFEMGDSGTAVRALDEMAAVQPASWDVAAPLLASLVQLGEFDKALAVVRRTEESAERTPLGPFYRGRVLAAKGDLAGASSAFTDALAVDPRFIPALYFRAHVFAARGEPEAGKIDLKDILRQDPGNSYASEALSRLLLDEGLKNQAAAVLLESIRRAPKDPAPRLALANVQTELGRYADARSTLNAVLEISKNDPEALAQIGRIQLKTGQPQLAIETFRSLAAAYPDSAKAYLLLGDALKTINDRLAALDAARRAVELAPLSTEAWSALIDYLFFAGRTQDALAKAEEIARDHPGPRADILLANAFIRLNRGDEAASYLSSRFSKRPDRLLALQLSQIAMTKGDREKAFRILRDWLRSHSDDFVVRRQYGSLLAEAGDLVGARNEFESLLRVRPEDPVVLNNLGWLLRRDDPSRALSLVSLAARIAPDSADIMDSFAWLKFQSRDLDGALALLRRAHELEPADGEIGYHMSLVLDAAGKRSEAKTLLSTVVEESNEFTDKGAARELLGHW